MTQIEITPPDRMDQKVGLAERLRRYAKLVRLDRPIGILLLLWPTLCALWIAGAGQPPWRIVVIFMLGVVLMRSAGCAINDYADREIDGKVARTCKRPLAMGLVSPREAIAIFMLLCLLAFGLVLFLNRETIQLAVVAVALAAFYPFTKRYTHFPQVVLGAAFGWAVPMAFMAVSGSIPAPAWLLFTATLLWALVYDTQYAMVDREDDLKVGVKSTAILFGRHDVAIIAVLQLAVLLLLALTGVSFSLGLIYYIGLVVAAGFFVYQWRLIRTREAKPCFEAFLNNNLFGMTVFVGLLLDYMLPI